VQPQAHPRRERVIARLAELRDRWPAVFRPHTDPGPWPPLKVGVHLDIAMAAPELAVPRGLLREALRLYTSRDPYLAGLVKGAARFGLDGEPCGTVTAEQANSPAP
jgi:ProP effector